MQGATKSLLARMKCSSVIGSLLCTIVLLLRTLPIHPQTITGNIGGAVTDASGAAVANAEITAMNVTNGFIFDTKSNETGRYNLRFLPIGQYKVSVAAPGFSAQVFGPFSLEIDQDAEVDIALKVGSTTTKIDVNADFTPLLNTENSTIATTFTANAIDNVPLTGRDVWTLLFLLPGAVNTSPSLNTATNGTERDTSTSEVLSVNGNRTTQNNYSLDGIEINETINNDIGYNPSPDALGEVKVISADAPAEYGNVNGGEVLAVTKSGTNEWHGSASDYLANWKLDANSWANKHQSLASAIVPKTHYTQQVFGGTVGGPILRNRLFFFADYEGLRWPSSGLGTVNVATPAMRQGDFSELLSGFFATLTPGGIQLWNNSNNATTGPVAYANNQIPIVNSAAKYIFTHPNIYPLPNTTIAASADPIVNNYTSHTYQDHRNDQGEVHIDWKPNQRDTISGRWLEGEGQDYSTALLAIDFPGVNAYPTKGVAINESHVFSTSLVNEFRAGYTRVRWIQSAPHDYTGVFGLDGNSLLGINALQELPGFSGLGFACGGSATGCSSYDLPQNFGNSSGGNFFVDNTFQYGDNLTWLKGHHQFKAGVIFTRYQNNSPHYGGNGSFSYYPTYTMNVATNQAGFALADFALDASSGISASGINPDGTLMTGGYGIRQWREGYFVQDDWRLLQNLTLNLGVRYEYDQPMYEAHNQEANIDFGTKTIELAGVDGNSRALYSPTYANLMPRMGANYRPTDKIVVRGGFGTTAFLEGAGGDGLVGNPPFWRNLSGAGISPTTSNSGTFFEVENGFKQGALAGLAGTTYDAYHNVKPSLSAEWSLATEYAVTSKANLTVAYVGEQGQHLSQAVSANQLTAPCVVNGVVDTATTSATCAAVDPAPFYNIVGQNGRVLETTSEAMMNYNALQSSFRQHATHGLEYALSYTWSRAMTNSPGWYGVPSVTGPSAYAQNAYNNHAEYGPAGQDVRHTINGNLVYELPFGRGRQFGGNWNRALDEIGGGWKVAGTGVFYGGFPVTISGNDNSATNARAARPNQYRKLHIANRSINHWFGTDASAIPCTANGVDNGVCAYGNTAYGTFGTASPGTQRAPSFQQYDFSAYKDFSIWREHKLTFRADFLNAFNISSYGNPANNYAASNFGQITGVRSVPRQVQLAGKWSF
jgi:outer membrane receptor protein involved in Fe transport